MTKAAQLNVKNIDFMLEQPPRAFEWIRFDSTNDCNLHCVYCHNARSDELMNLDKLQQFLDKNVESIENFQFGCVMEPTLDKRMADIMLLVAQSKGGPSDQMMLQTNGILLHTHDHQKMTDAGLTHLSLSIDSPHEPTFRLLRGGAKLEKIFRNMTKFREACPDVIVQFITTVNTANINEMEDLIDWGLEIGVHRFILREMFFDQRNRVVNHQDMRMLVLPKGEFAHMQVKIQKKYDGQAHFHFSAADNLVDYASDVRAASYPTSRPSQLVQVQK